ncbi:MAG TPA: hypothetical protein VHS99_23095 [Chloroflexota bacterium]|jgi:hypothetical protein|nr:hypothetical protein [Chloroflexota bacterium]
MTPLYVIFTLDGAPYRSGCLPKGPATWEASARTIDAFCTTLLRAGFPPTVFVTPETAAEHAPLLEEFRAGTVDVGLLLQPPSLHHGGYRHYLGAYDGATQGKIVREALGRFEGALGYRPLSARTAMFSASDETYAVLAGAGFRHTSLSSPGRHTPKYQAAWDGAATDAHYASATSRLEPGTLPLLEVPVTTDATQRRGGIAPDLAIENGTLERWHAPLIDAQLARQEAAGLDRRALCFTSATDVTYDDRASRPRRTLDDLVEYLLSLGERYELVPTTLAGAYAHFRRHLT